MYRAQSLRGLNIPVRTIVAAELQTLFAMPAIRELDRLMSPTSSYNTKHSALFHGCGTGLDSETIASFSELGPSTYFARPCGYFSPSPAVYWTNSLKFAIAWCLFTQTGRWSLNDPHAKKACSILIYVSLLDLTDMATTQECCFLPSPGSLHDEEYLMKVSNIKLSKLILHALTTDACSGVNKTCIGTFPDPCDILLPGRRKLSGTS